MTEYTFVIADLHGRYDLLMLALGKISKYSTGGTVVFTGDYIDRGPDSNKVIQRIMEGPLDNSDCWKWVIIRGNHEDMMLMSVLDEKWIPSWLGNGGETTLASYDYGVPDMSHLEWCNDLPRLWSDTYRVYVHASVDEYYNLDSQPHDITQWGRYDKNEDVGYRGKHVVHGHTQHKEPELLKNRTNLDTGAYKTGRLVVGVFDNNKAGGPVDLIEVRL